MTTPHHDQRDPAPAPPPRTRPPSSSRTYQTTPKEIVSPAQRPRIRAGRQRSPDLPKREIQPRRPPEPGKQRRDHRILGHGNGSDRSLVHHVLIVEDDPTFARLIALILDSSEDERYESVTAGTMHEAALHLEHTEFDIIIADLGLPDSKGHTTIETLTNIAPDVPIVVLTGNDEGVDQSLTAIRTGAAYFLRKGSVDPAAVERGMRYAIGRRQLRSLLQDER